MTRFKTEDGIVHAVNGISYALDAGESLAIVGESGSGKTVNALSILGLIPSPPGWIDQGEVWFKGRNLLKGRIEGRPNLLKLDKRSMGPLLVERTSKLARLKFFWHDQEDWDSLMSHYNNQTNRYQEHDYQRPNFRQTPN